LLCALLMKWNPNIFETFSKLRAGAFEGKAAPQK